MTVANSESEPQMEGMALQSRVRCLWLASPAGFPIISPWVERVSVYTACVFTNRSSNSALKYQNKLLLVGRLCWPYVQAGDLIRKRWLLERLRPRDHAVSLPCWSWQQWGAGVKRLQFSPCSCPSTTTRPLLEIYTKGFLYQKMAKMLLQLRS